MGANSTVEVPQDRTMPSATLATYFDLGDNG